MAKATKKQYQEALCAERVELAAEWMTILPPFPPSCLKMTLKFHYDDGHDLILEVEQKE